MGRAGDGSVTTLGELAEAYWDAYLLDDPVQGTAIGDRRYGDRLSDITPAGRHYLARRYEGLRERVEAVLPDSADPEAHLTRSALLSAIGSRLTFLGTEAPSYTVDAMSGPQNAFMSIPTFQPLDDPADGEAMLSRWRTMGPWLDDLIANLRDGLANGRAPVAGSVRRVVDQLDQLLSRPVESWTLLAPLEQQPAGWPDAEWQTFADALQNAVRYQVRSAFARYRTFLADEVLGASRDEDHVGIGHLPDGPERYRQLVRAHTTTDHTPDELHGVGRVEVARIDAELTVLGARVLDTESLAATLAALRGDASVHFANGDEIVDVAERSLARAQEATPGWFGRLPRTGCEVVRMLPHEERHTTIAYYREPAQDGSRPGRYYVNTFAPETRPRYEAEALAFHEAVPGHHLQVAIGQELARLPAFRRHADSTAYVEGWGLYAERLADEMELYSGDLDRIGMLSYDAWRACRLVVDTGMHALAWSRGQAIEFMAAHTALGLNNIENEVDRYIGWPGQALAYKVGQLEIARLRRDAEAGLGGAFDVRGFHDAVLDHGALPLATLRDSVSADLGLDLAAPDS
jgi:uncharacterized protein (DUF885 family)